MVAAALSIAAFLHCPMITGGQPRHFQIMRFPIAESEFSSLASLEAPQSRFVFENEEPRSEWVFGFDAEGRPVPKQDFISGRLLRVVLMPDNHYLARFGTAEKLEDGRVRFQRELFGDCELRQSDTKDTEATQ